MKQKKTSSASARKRLDTYIVGVLEGTIPAGKYVRLAAERHRRDLQTAKQRGLRFDNDDAQHAVGFFEKYLRHTKGKWAGQPFVLEPWQVFVIASIFGWKNADGNRRYQSAYNELARKQGKSTMAAGVGLYLTIADGEAGAEVYSAATKRDQARIVHSQAKSMVRRSPDLRRFAEVLRDNISVERTESKFEPLSSDYNTMDGLNVHGAIIDELHAHKTRDVYDVLVTAVESREQPLIFVITTAGWQSESICREQHDYAVQVLEQLVEDDSLFAFIATIDEEDDWQDEACWIKANPNLGVSARLSSLRTKAKKARETPAFENTFRRLHLNQWTQQSVRWMPIETWDSCAGENDEKELEGTECYGGLDLASTTDIAAFALVFPQDGGKVKVLPTFWIPEENMLERSRKDKVPYGVWVKQGLIQATQGNVIDYDVIRAAINELGEKYNIQEIGLDRWNATQLATQLQGDGFDLVPVGQGFRDMSAPTKELMRLVLDKKLEHGGNPILRWMANNMAVKEDEAGNLKPDRAKSSDKIDGMVALVMGLDRATRHKGGPSVYEERGIRTL